MRTVYEIENEIDCIVDELRDINDMTDEEAAVRFNVNSKAEIIALDNERLKEISNELDSAFGREGYDAAEEIFGSHLAMEEYLY